MGKAETASRFHDKGYNCAQSVLAACAEELGAPLDAALRVSTGFGGGMGRMAHTCGAVTGAFMALGLRHGMGTEADPAAKERTYALVRRYAEAFEARHGSLQCRELLGVDISTPEGMEAARRDDLFRARCSKLIAGAAELLEEMLAE